MRNHSLKPLIVFVSLVLSAAAGSVYAQGRGSARTDQTPIVEAVGCLSQTGSDWILTDATEAATVTTTFTTPEAVKAAAEKPLGTQQYRLLGTRPFSPDPHKGHKMVVKGLLIKGDSESRINVTSLQMLAETCAK
jgi:hypothetical protein